MKKSILIFAVIGVLLAALVSCSDNKIKDVRVLVATLDMKGDTLNAMKTTLDGDTLLFSLKDVRFNNGIMLHGDSVIVNYIKGHGDTLRALVVTILPKAPSYFDSQKAEGDTLATMHQEKKDDADKVKK